MDSLWSVWNDIKRPDTSRLKAMLDISQNGFLFSNPDSAYMLAGKMELLANEKKEKSYEAKAVNVKGIACAITGKTKEAVTQWEKSYKISKSIGDKLGMSGSYNNIGNIYADKGDYKSALDYYKKSLQLKREVGDSSLVAASLNNIGIIFKDMNEHQQAIDYYKMALAIDVKNEDKRGIAPTLNNLATLFDEIGQIDTAMKYYQMSFDLYTEINEIEGVARVSNNLASVYLEMKDFEKAKELFLSALSISKKGGFVEHEARALRGLGVVAQNYGDNPMALKYYESSLMVAKGAGVLEEVQKAAELAWLLYKDKGQYKKSLEAFEQFITAKDSIESEQNHKAVIQQEFQYKYEKKAAADSIKAMEEAKVQDALLTAEKAETEKQKIEAKQQEQQKLYLFAGLILALLFGGFIFNRFRVTSKQKIIIEDQKHEVEKQKNTVEVTLTELESTHIKLESTHEQLEESHKEITDSINYAERIQRSFLATKETLDENLKDYFVFFKPKEAVSGDFYWAAQLNNNNFAFTVADSTGHGVPGAIMSLLNITSLEKSIETETEPHKILNKTREIIVNRLSKDGSEHGGKDGMDCNLMVLNQDKSVLTFASANNTIVIIREGEILEYKGDKMPVGKHDKDTESFTLHSVQLQKGDVIYALTDGFPDQFGGPKGKKYMIKNLKNKFLQIANMPMPEQEATLEKEFSTWMEDNEQIDDVCIIGVRV